jgi:hypothetical protein
VAGDAETEAAFRNVPPQAVGPIARKIAADSRATGVGVSLSFDITFVG